VSAMSEKNRKRRSSRKHFRFIGYRIRRKLFYGIVSLLLLPPLIFSLVAYLFLQSSSNSSSLPVAAVPAEPVEEAAAEPLGELASLLWQHRQASGLKETSSMTLLGTFIQDGRPFDLALSMRMPAMVRKRVRDDIQEVLLVSSGTSSQERTTLANNAPLVRALPQADIARYSLLLEGAAFRLAEDDAPAYFSYELMSEVTRPGCRRIVSKDPAGVSIAHEIDTESGLEVERSMEIPLDGEQSVLTMLLEDYRRVDNVMLPHRYYLELDGLRRVEVDVQSFKLNPVMPLWFFALERESETG